MIHFILSVIISSSLLQANNFDHQNIKKTALRQRTQWLVISLEENESFNVTDLAPELDNVVTITIPHTLGHGKSKNPDIETKVCMNHKDS